MLVLESALEAGKAEPISRKVSIPVRTKSFTASSWKKSKAINLIPGGWFSQGIVPCQGLSLTSAVVSCALSKDGSQIALVRDGPHR